MLKKMWGIMIDGTIPVCYDMKCSAENRKKVSGGEIKQVYITDKDPFKNVRKLMDDNLDYNYNPVDLENAILKDKTNFDNLTATGESLFTGELGIVKTKKETK